MNEETSASDDQDMAAAWGEELEKNDLGQGDIDALFTDGSAPAPSYETVVERIIHEAVANYDRLPMLDIVFDRLVMMVTTSFKRLTTANGDISIDTINSMRFNEAMGNLPLPGLLAVVNARPWGGQFVIAIDAPLLYASIELMLGGRKSSPAKPEGRSFTSIERRLAGKLMQTILEDLQEAFSPLCKVDFEIERIETNPQFATVAQNNSPAVHAIFNAKIDDRPGQFEFVIPYGTIDPIRNILQKVFLGEKLGGDPAWERHLEEEIQAARVLLDGNLHEFETTLGKVLDWKVGETLDLYIPADQRIQITCGNVSLFSSRIGQMNGNLAVKIEADLGGKKDMVDALVQR